MFCSKCGKQLVSDAAFCSGCGAAVQAEANDKMSANASPVAHSAESMGEPFKMRPLGGAWMDIALIAAMPMVAFINWLAYSIAGLDALMQFSGFLAMIISFFAVAAISISYTKKSPMRYIALMPGIMLIALLVVAIVYESGSPLYWMFYSLMYEEFILFFVLIQIAIFSLAIMRTVMRVTKYPVTFGFAVLGYFVPLAGLLIYLAWSDKRPLRAKAAGKGALISVIVNAVLAIAAFIVFWIILA